MITVATVPAKHTAHTLLGTIAWLREDPENRRVKPRLFAAEEMDLPGFMAWFRRQLDRKITEAAYGVQFNPADWRKLEPDWQRAAGHTARAVNTPRLRVYEREVMPEFRARLAHRIVQIGEEQWS